MRIKYIDTLRGAAMYMVVYSHILSFSINPYTPSLLGIWMEKLMLPLFFFISGYVAFKHSPKTGWKEFRQTVLQKFKLILLPTLIMMTIMCISSGSNLRDNFFHYDKAGYWFTLVLFQILLIYIPFLILSANFNNIIIKLLCISIPYPLMMIVFHVTGFESQISILFEWVKVKYFYRFFLLGSIFRICESYFSSKSINSNHKGIIIIISFIFNIISMIYLPGKYDFITLISGIIFIYFVFKSLSPWYDEKNSIIWKALSEIGSFTLPIYLLHFFFLFRLPNCIRDYLISLQQDHCYSGHSCNSLVEFIIIGTCAIFISYFCIFLSKLLKKISSPFAKYCIGY